MSGFPNCVTLICTCCIWPRLVLLGAVWTTNMHDCEQALFHFYESHLKNVQRECAALQLWLPQWLPGPAFLMAWFMEIRGHRRTMEPQCIMWKWQAGQMDFLSLERCRDKPLYDTLMDRVGGGEGERCGLLEYWKDWSINMDFFTFLSAFGFTSENIFFF